MSAPFPSVIIEDLSPAVDGGKFPIKRVPGQWVHVEATIYKEGHETLLAMLQWREAGSTRWQETAMEPLGNYRWKGSFQVTTVGWTEFTIEAWGDSFESWLEEIQKKEADGITNLCVEALEGAALIRSAAKRCKSCKKNRELLLEVAQQLEEASKSFEQSLTRLTASESFRSTMRAYPDRSLATAYEPAQRVRVDRARANLTAWYEFFPRSAQGKKDTGSSLRETLERIDEAKEMGFDVIYFPPIHPIGLTARKGPNNSTEASPKDPGVPYAIGNALGGHDAIEPGLGTMKDFEWLIQELKKRDMELALDFALNCSPDHPYIREHPEWFFHRPDGSIKYAENPPKKYEDVFPLNFYNPHWQELWQELRRILLFWAERGVRTFRVDNPHTKPMGFWEWVIKEVQQLFPDVIFLSEAFTHPAMMKYLAKIGFTQSYSYFTWRNSKQELQEYFTELTQSEMKEYFRAHLFTNTPDILPFYLQEGGRASFLIRSTLAATLSPSYGIYSGFELCENKAIPGKEEYADSEKYQYKERDWNAPGNIKPWITRLNQIRKNHRALQTMAPLQFCNSDNPSILAYLKSSEDEKEHLFIIVNLNPHHQESGMVEFPLHKFGFSHESSYIVHDLLTNECYHWKGAWNFILLNPSTNPAHIFLVTA
ncbi:MAG: alpha-1,4-glucan--maltose-1-phosphate maltosyltransferase [Chthoniobacterales bacterium]|nr:alpha-1,4-glucan--maltose-1-phosphate maltosyltransferase [Chthoniobacterales bacterium]